MKSAYRLAAAALVTTALTPANPLYAQDNQISFADTAKCEQVHNLWASQGAGSSDDRQAAMVWRKIGQGEFPDISAQERAAGRKAGLDFAMTLAKKPAGGEDRLIYLMDNLTNCLNLRTANMQTWIAYESGKTPPKTVKATTNGPITSGYHYPLNYETAAYCGVHNSYLSGRLEDKDPLRSRQHKAMARSWFTVGAAITDLDKDGRDAVFKRMANMADQILFRASAAKRPPEPDYQSALQYCDVMRGIYKFQYKRWTDIAAKNDPDLFVDDAAYVSQSGRPPKGKAEGLQQFGPWYLNVLKDDCIGVPQFTQGANFYFVFSNKLSGSSVLRDSTLAPLDLTDDAAFAASLAPHKVGFAINAIGRPVLKEGVTYDNFEGSAIFVDGEIAAGLTSYFDSKGDANYVFGKFQDGYYDMLPAGKVATIKILGEEKYRFDLLQNPDFWNEMTNCIAGYPNG